MNLPFFQSKEKLIRFRSHGKETIQKMPIHLPVKLGIKKKNPDSKQNAPQGAKKVNLVSNSWDVSKNSSC